MISRQLRSVALCAALAASPLAAQTRTDAAILIDARNVFLQQPVFKGMAVEPTVRHGVVTLTGTVSSDAAKILASDRVGQIEGVKTVLNNLTVAEAARPAPAASAAAPASTGAGTADGVKILTLVPPAVIPVRLEDQINTKNAKVGDTFHGVTAMAVYQSGVVLIPAHTPVMGRVVSTKAARPFVGYAQLSLELTAIRLTVPQTEDRTLRLATLPLSNGSTHSGGLLGSSASVGSPNGTLGSTSQGGSQPGTQIVLPPETILQFSTADPLLVAIQFRDGQPVPSPAATGEAVLPQDAAAKSSGSQPH